jgi:SAM-dependent methyltransferase
MTEPLSEARAAELRDAVRTKYRTVSHAPSGQFPYPVGRESVVGLGYETAWLNAIPDAIVAGFVGVGNPFGVVSPHRGERVLDLGCGCGLDVFVASLLVGPEGDAVGVDLTPEMIERAEQAAGAWSEGSAEFVVGGVESLPFEDDTFDLAISNGALNLVPDKRAAFREACRVLKPGGTFAVADLLVTETIPKAVLSSLDAWST